MPVFFRQLPADSAELRLGEEICGLRLARLDHAAAREEHLGRQTEIAVVGTIRAACRAVWDDLTLT